MKTLSVDIETFSPVDLTKAGVYAYSEHQDFEILLFAYAYDDEPVTVIDMTDPEDKLNMPFSLLTDITGDNPDVICSAFNANFERVCLSHYFSGLSKESNGSHQMYISPKHWRCSAVKARYAGLPGYLDGAAKAIGLQQEKDAAGKRLIQYFSKPCKPTKKNGGRTRNLPEHDPEKWEQFKAYCIQDVEVERALSKSLEHLPVPEHEWSLWFVDQQINDRGCKLDMQLVDNALQLNRQYTAELKEQMQQITGCDNPNSLPQLKTWLSERTGERVNTLSKETAPKLMKATDDDKVEKVLSIRKELGKTSTSKYEAMKRSVCTEDDRVRGLLMFYGASRTGRWAGRLVQVQNLPQNKIPDIDLARDLLRHGDYETIELLFSSPSVILSQLIRTAFIPSPGKRFIISDFSAIEARVIAWLAGEQWRLDVFGSHGKIYEASASAMFGVPIEKITKDSPLRAKGKVAELALGYQGSVGALKQMGGEKLGLSEEEMQQIVNTWREANPKIVQLWSDLEEAALRAIDRGDTAKKIETHGLQLIYRRGNLLIKLPSKRILVYPHAKITENRFGRSGIVYLGTHPGGYGEIETYGGKLTENVVQAIARDCLAEAMIRLESYGHRIVMHVHDEVVIEGNEGDLSAVNRLMGKSIDWAPGLPLKGDGFETDYYMKD